MAEPGDQEPKTSRPVDDPDLHVGFVTPYSLTGQTRRPPEPEAEPEPEPEPEPVVEPEAEPELTAEPAFPSEPAFEPDAAALDPTATDRDDEPDLFDPPKPVIVADPEPAPKPEPDPEPVVVEAPEPIPPVVEPVVAAAPPPPARDPYVAAPPPITAPPALGRSLPPRERARAAAPAVPTGMYAVYILILLAVPTLGVSAAIALLAVTGREAPNDPLTRGHFLYQQRTLWAGAVAALLGVILIVINVGVFVLFVLALWLMARGVFGLLKLMGGKPLNNPRSWLF